MRATRLRRVERLEDASTLRMARAVARDYELTEEETADMLRDTKRALARWRAGLPIGLAWVQDEAAAECGLDAAERAALEEDVCGRLGERSLGGVGGTRRYDERPERIGRVVRPREVTEEGMAQSRAWRELRAVPTAAWEPFPEARRAIVDRLTAHFYADRTARGRR